MKNKPLLKTAYISIMASLICVCAWITVPFPIPFTMQTFGVFTALLLLGGKDGTAVIGLYLLLGAVGLPVFSSFSSGLGYLAGATGGYLVGFLLCAAAFAVYQKFRKNPKRDTIALGVCSISYYICGTVWFLYSTYKGDPRAITLQSIALCTLPYVIPDAVKLILAHLLTQKLKRKLPL